MNRTLSVGFLAIFLSFPTSLFGQDEDIDTSDRRVVRETVTVFNEQHLTRSAVNQELGNRWLTVYLRDLDPNLVYFLESDIKDFKDAAAELPELAKSGELTFCQLVTNRYKSRFKEADKQIRSFLNNDFDFTVDESLPTKFGGPPKSKEEQYERLRLLTKYDVLVELSAGATIEEARSFLTGRYDTLGNTIESIDDEISLRQYINAFCEAQDPHSGYLSSTEFHSFLGAIRHFRQYTLGLFIDHREGRSLIRRVAPEFRSHSHYDELVGCELLAIRSEDGEIFHTRGIGWYDCSQLIQWKLGETQEVVLELYDETRLRRFQITWPRRYERW